MLKKLIKKSKFRFLTVVAAELGISDGMLHRICRGDRFLKYAQAVRCAELLGAGINDLLPYVNLKTLNRGKGKVNDTSVSRPLEF